MRSAVPSPVTLCRLASYGYSGRGALTANALAEDSRTELDIGLLPGLTTGVTLLMRCTGGGVAAGSTNDWSITGGVDNGSVVAGGGSAIGAVGSKLISAGSVEKPDAVGGSALCVVARPITPT